MADEDIETGDVDPKIESQAKEMGWTPLEKFKGDPDKWVDAEEFVRRGEHLMPILRQNNNRLKQQLLQRDREIDTLKSELGGMKTALDKLETHYTAANKAAAERAIESLKTQLKEAREDQDVDKEVELLSQIGLAQDEVRRIGDEAEAAKKKSKEPPKQKPQPRDGVDPALADWQENNTWFGTDDKKTKQFNRIAEDLRDEINESGETLVGVPFLERCEELWKEKYGDGTPPSKTDGGKSNSGTAQGAAVKGWNQLPKDAKDACLADVDYLVGEGKRYKTLDDWKKEYVRIYNSI